MTSTTDSFDDWRLLYEKDVHLHCTQHHAQHFVQVRLRNDTQFAFQTISDAWAIKREAVKQVWVPRGPCDVLVRHYSRFLPLLFPQLEEITYCHSKSAKELKDWGDETSTNLLQDAVADLQGEPIHIFVEKGVGFMEKGSFKIATYTSTPGSESESRSPTALCFPEQKAYGLRETKERSQLRGEKWTEKLCKLGGETPPAQIVDIHSRHDLDFRAISSNLPDYDELPTTSRLTTMIKVLFKKLDC